MRVYLLFFFGWILPFFVQAQVLFPLDSAKWYLKSGRQASSFDLTMKLTDAGYLYRTAPTNFQISKASMIASLMKNKIEGW